MPRAGWLAAGALLASQLPITSPWGMAGAALAAVLLVGAVASVITRRMRLGALLVGAGVVALRVALPAVVAADPSLIPLTSGISGVWTAQVVAIGSTNGGLQRTVLKVELADRRPLHVYAWLPRYPIVTAGDRIELQARLEPPPRDGSGFADFLARGGFEATARPRSFRVTGSNGGLMGEFQIVRRLADEALARALPEPEAGLASGIVVGRRDRVSRDVADDFSVTGLSHVVAISGWNIALVGAVIGGLLVAAGLQRRARTIAIITAVVLYTLLAGGGASVVRAAVMGGVALVARETGRPGTAASALGLAVAGLLLLDPQMSSDIGFQLSVAATAGLLAWGGPMTSVLTDRLRGRGGHWLAESLGVSLAAQFATLPIVLYHFGRLSLISPLANLAIAPLVAPAMLGGVLALAGGLLASLGIPAFMLTPVTFIAWLVLGSMVGIADVLASVPLASVALPAPWDLLGAAASALVVLVAAVRHRALGALPPEPPTPPTRSQRGKSRRVRPVAVVAVSLVGCLIAAVVALGITRSEPRLVLSVMDVGQGDAILLEGPSGSRILVDSGPDPDRLMAVLDSLVPAWDRRLDLVVLSHPHEDHVAGLALLMDRFRVGSVAENGMIGNGPGDHAFRQRLAREGTSTVRLAAGDRLNLDGARIDVLWPRLGSVPARAPSSGKAVNNTSVVMDVRIGVRRLLLMGDVEEDVDPVLLGAGIAAVGAPRLDVLKVAHHGSGTATTDEFLDAARPGITLVSAGLGNPYGHPAASTIERLEAHGASVLRTDLDGTLQVSTDGRDLRVATTGGRPAARSAQPVTASTPTIAQAVRCAIPLPMVAAAVAAETRNAHPPRSNLAAPRQLPMRPPPWDPCYDRTHDDSLPCRGGRAAAGSIALGPAGTSLHRRGRGRRVSRRPRAPPRHPCRPASG
jgi:competence protein ComEC